MFTGLLSSCTGPSVQIDHWLSTADEQNLLEKQEPFATGGSTQDADTVIVLDNSELLQEMDGFGASMTESSGYALSHASVEDQERIMRLLFSRTEGIGISFLRQPMGAPDFAVSIYSYDDMPLGQADPEMEHFSIDGDRAYILPYLKRAKEINPDLKIMASPWSPPGWMKTGGTMLGASGGVLKPEYYSAYADYFVRFIQAYEAEGLPIYAVTPQNEMNYGPPAYPGMVWSPGDAADFVKNHLGPAFVREGLDTKIMIYDHNWDRADLARTMLQDTILAPFIAGSAWHYYGGGAETMTEIHNEFPEMGIWFTEGGSGRWIANGTFRGTFKDGISQAIRITSNWAKSVIWWNVALDQNNGPIVFPNTANYGLVSVNTETRETGFRASFYTIGHLSKFVLPGAHRIKSSADNDYVMQVAFLNPDGTHALLLFNRFNSPMSARVEWSGAPFTYELPPEGAATLVW